MGGSFSNMFGGISNAEPYQIVFFGLEAAGKTSLLYRLQTNTFVETEPTSIGFNYETITFKIGDVEIWDVGGGRQMSALWRRYYGNKHYIVYVLDASDKIKARIAADKLYYVLSSVCRAEHTVLFLANKQDLGTCLTEDEIIQIFRLREGLGIKWHIQPCSIKEWYGVTEGMDWLFSEMSK